MMDKPIWQAIEQYQKIVILRHINPDYDCLGAQFGLYHYLNKQYPSKEISCGGYQKSLDSSYLPDPTSYDLNYYLDALCIIVDTSVLERLDGQDILANCASSILIDHHVKGPSFTKLELINNQASSCCEIITELLMNKSEGKPLDNQTAECLYIGIIADSQKFSINSTTAKTFAMASYLLNSKLDINKINNQAFSMNQNEYRFNSYIQSIANYDDPCFVYVIVSKQLREQYHLTCSQAKSRVSTFGMIQGVKVWTIIAQEDDGSYSASLRSHSIDINVVARKFSGGGHLCASGISHLMKEQIPELINLLKERADC